MVGSVDRTLLCIDGSRRYHCDVLVHYFATTSKKQVVSSALSLKVVGESNLMETVCADLPLVGMGLITKLKT